MAELVHTAEILELFGEAAECSFDGPCTPAENMRRDWERLLACAHDPEVPPLLRFYQWRPWGLSLGLHQREELVDWERCRLHGIEVVRRPTGGRAVLHAEEITYAVIARLSAERTPQTLYRRIHERIAAALQSVTGKPILFAPTHTELAQPHRRPLAAACFTSSARWELLYAGRKLVGSAQRIVEGVLLQHGSLLLGEAHLLLAELLRFPSEADRQLFRQRLAAQSITLSQITGTACDTTAVVRALWESFCGTPPTGQLQLEGTTSGTGSSSA